jgi:putative ABC transport system substrate-binding protein
MIAGLTALLIAPEHPSAKQAPEKVPRVGILSVAESERAAIFDAFRQGLRDLGYVEGRNIILEFRLARGDLSRGLQLAAELVALPVDVIVSEGIAVDTVDPSGRIPIVGPVMMDPVERGFARFTTKSNLTGSKTAKELGLTIPPSILAAADEVIE